jgi:ornithine carbamoyltransferase
MDNLLRIADITAKDISQILETARRMKGNEIRQTVEGKTIALLFEKPSLRTRVSFEVAMNKLGGYTINLTPQEIGLNGREPLEDIARVLDRYVDGIVLRTFAQETIDVMAQYTNSPVINALSDLEHPCQALADLLTISEYKEDLSKLTVAFIGDGNNVSTSLALACSLIGASFRIACPTDYQLPENIVANVSTNISNHGGSFEQLTDPRSAVQGADVIYTDVWVSMGQGETRDARLAAFQGYQVTENLIGQAKNDAIFMHDLPAHRGEEISEHILDHPQSVVFDQAENRLHVQQAILAILLQASDKA